MLEDYQRSAPLYMEDAMKLIESAGRWLEFAKSTSLPITRRLLALTICRGALRVSKDILDILSTQLLGTDCSSSHVAESTAQHDSSPSDGARHTDGQTVNTESRQGPQDTAPIA